MGEMATPAQELKVSKAAFGIFEDWQNQFQAPIRSASDALLASFKKHYPGWHVTVTDNTDLISFADAGKAIAVIDVDKEVILKSRNFQPAPDRTHKDQARMGDRIKFAKYNYTWGRFSYVIYMVELDEDGYTQTKTYVLTQSDDVDNAAKTPQYVDNLIIAASKWSTELQDEILVFDQQCWGKDKKLFEAVKSASWDDVILDKQSKNSLVQDIDTFFDCEADYKKFAVPWKRGMIFHGTPGNGKTISIKALMNSLASRKDPIPSLVVKSLAGCGNDSYAIRQIFVTARRYSPCLLIFEDLDSLVNDNVKSFFLNEVDGLEDNNGLMMIGSTNYLEKLDAGISKRPGRFDRKFHFALPAEPERKAYCDYWREKLLDNKELEFPENLSSEIAAMTADFSFAYLKEVFLTSLLTIVGAQKGISKFTEDLPSVENDADELQKLLLWRVSKKQVNVLRLEMEGARKSAEDALKNKENEKDDD